MVTELKKGGFPVASIAQLTGVERKTVHSWLEGNATPHPDCEERVAAVYPVLKERFNCDFVLMYRVLRAKDRDGSSLESLFQAAKIDVEAVKRQLAFLDTSIKTIQAAEARKKAKPFKEMAGRNGAIDEFPVAVFENISDLVGSNASEIAACLTMQKADLTIVKHTASTFDPQNASKYTMK